MLKTIQMQKAKPTQKQNKKPTHNAGKITKKKLKKPKFIGGAKNISELSIKEKLGFLKHCLDKTIQGDLRAILYTANANALKYFPTYEVGYIDMFKIVIKYVLLCLINNSTNNEYKDTVRSNNCYLLLKKYCPDDRCKSSIDFESEKDLESNEEEELNKIADQYYDTFKNYVSEIVGNPHDNKIINKYIKAIYPDGIAILTKKSDNDKYDLKINNSEILIEENSRIIDFLKNNTNTKFLIILKKESSNTDNTDETDVYNCMMQIIMKLVDIFSSENNSKYYEMIINGTDLSMNEDASIERLKVAEEKRPQLIANQTNKETEQNQTEEQVVEQKAEAKTPETATATIAAKEAEKVEKVEKKAKEEADKKAAKAETIKKREPDTNLDKLLNYIFNDDNTKQLDLQRQAILLKSLKMICYNKLYKLYGRNFNKEIDNKYTAIINKTKENINEIIKESIYTYALPELRCNSSEMIEAYQHIINILVPKYGLDITEECYETLIALSDGMTDNDCKTTIRDILTQKSYLLSEPTIIKVLLTEQYLKNLGTNKKNPQNDLNKTRLFYDYKNFTIQELNKFKDKVLNILHEILNVPVYKDTQSKVLKIYKSLLKIIDSNPLYSSTLKSELVDDIVKEYDETKNKTYPIIQKTPEETKFDELLDIIFEIFKGILTITGKLFSYTKHGIILRSLKLICYNKLNKLFRNYNDHIDRKYIDKLNEMGFVGKKIESNESFKIHKAIDGISGTQYCDDIEMIKAYQDIINILYQGKRIPKIEDINISLLIELSTGYLTPDCKKTINKIINEESYLLSESRIMDIELDGDFLISDVYSNESKSTYPDKSAVELALKKYNQTITEAIDKATIYDIKNKLWKNYDDLSKKIKSRYPTDLQIATSLPPIPPIPRINKPEPPKKNRRIMNAQRKMKSIRRL
jgi:hypothetical protein